MRKIIFALYLFLIAICFASFKNAQTFEPIAVIELFTSQGCSSCPPADKLLTQTIRDANSNGKKIFALSFHVDYWNRLGWADPFSDKKYSQRQSDYVSALNLNGAYTPQMIVNGSTQFVGSDKSSLDNTLANAFQTKATANFKTLSATFEECKAPHIHYELEGDFTDCKINFALVSLTETTIVKRGENSGRTLVNENVVRQFISKPATSSGEIDFAVSPLSAKNNCAIIAYIQHSNRKISTAACAVIN